MKKYTNDGYSLTQIYKNHIEQVRLWRNHQMDGLRQNKIISNYNIVIF